MVLWDFLYGMVGLGELSKGSAGYVVWDGNGLVGRGGGSDKGIGKGNRPSYGRWGIECKSVKVEGGEEPYDCL